VGATTAPFLGSLSSLGPQPSADRKEYYSYSYS
jgi:hypothetical protein